MQQTICLSSILFLNGSEVPPKKKAWHKKNLKLLRRWWNVLWVKMTISVFFSYMKIIPTDFPILFWWYFRPFSAHVHAIVWAFKINLGEIRNYGIQNPYQMYRHLWVKIMHLWWRQSLDLTKQQKTTFRHAFRFLDFHEFWLFWFESKCKMF